MRVTTKGQVTIPQRIREKFGITPDSEVDFIEEMTRYGRPGRRIHSIITAMKAHCGSMT
jgi:AbrB family looped-hinge helix DNA binding protein